MNPSTELIAIARYNGGSVDANEKGEDKPFSAIELRSVLDDLWFRAYKVMMSNPKWSSCDSTLGLIVVHVTLIYLLASVIANSAERRC